MAKTKYYSVAGWRRVCMGRDIVTYPELFTSRQDASRFVMNKLNEDIDEWNRWPNRGHIEHRKMKDCKDGGSGGCLELTITEHTLVQSTVRRQS